MSNSITSKQLLQKACISVAILSLFACGGDLPQSNTVNSKLSPSNELATTSQLLAYSSLGVSDGENLIPASAQELADIKEAEASFQIVAAQESNIDGFIVHYKPAVTGTNSTNSSELESKSTVVTSDLSAKQLARTALVQYNQAGKSLGLAVQSTQVQLSEGTELRLNKSITLQQATDFSNKLMATDNRIQSIEPNVLFQSAALIPGQQVADRKYFDQWGLNQFSNTFATSSKKFGINQEQAWIKTTGETIGLINTGAPVVVAVLDTGKKDHEDLSSQYLPGFDFVSNAKTSKDNDGYDEDPTDPGDDYVAKFCGNKTSRATPTWHGTQVASVIAALMNNTNTASSGGMVGVAPNAKILPVRVAGPCGATLADVAAGIRWAAGGTILGQAINANPAKIINLSLSAPGAKCSPTLASAIKFANSQGAVVVVPAGNSKKIAGEAAKLTMPANCPDAITVSAIKEDGTRANNSNFGAEVDIAAPGEGIMVATFNNSTSDFAKSSGTSLAAAHVSGVLALMYAAQPNLTPAAATSLLKLHVAPLVDKSKPLGTGLLDATAAVSAVNHSATFVAKDDYQNVGKSQLLWKAPEGNYVSTALNFGANANVSETFSLNAETEFAFFNPDARNLKLGKFTDSFNQVVYSTPADQGGNERIIEVSALQPIVQFNPVPLGYQNIGIGNFYSDSFDEMAYFNAKKSTLLLRKFHASPDIEIGKLDKSIVVSKNLTPVGIADFNGDGYSDILWKNKNGMISVLYIAENVSLWQDVAKLAKNESLLGAGDFVGDTTADFVITNNKTALFTVYSFTKNGLINKTTSQLASGEIPSATIKIGDFDGDQKDEILTLESFGENSFWFVDRFSFDTNNQVKYKIINTENNANLINASYSLL